MHSISSFCIFVGIKSESPERGKPRDPGQYQEGYREGREWFSKPQHDMLLSTPSFGI